MDNVCCTVCGSIEGIHWHHVVPRSCGGEHGPQVPICGGHHSMVHALADALWAAKGDLESIRTRLPENIHHQRVVLELIRIIYVARSKTLRVDRPKKYSTTLPAKLHRKLVECTLLLDASQDKVVAAAIERLHQSLTNKNQSGSTLQNGNKIATSART